MAIAALAGDKIDPGGVGLGVWDAANVGKSEVSNRKPLTSFTSCKKCPLPSPSSTYALFTTSRDIMNKVSIALIHNHNAERNAYIRPRLEELQSALSSGFDVKLFEVAYQPEIKPHTMLMAFFRDVIYQVLDRDWLRYRLLPTIFLPRHIASFLLRSLTSGRYSRGGVATQQRH